MQGKNAIIKSSQLIESKTLCPPPISIFNFSKEVYYVVGLPEVVLYVIILGMDSKFDEFILECPGLLKETMNFTLDFHRIKFKNGWWDFVPTPPCNVCLLSDHIQGAASHTASIRG